MLSAPLNPLLILGLSVGFIVLAIAVFRLHAFFSLMLASALVALLTAAGKSAGHRFIHALDSLTAEFGTAAGRIAFTIALAAVIGAALMESGGAEKIVRRFIGAVGEPRAGVALMACGFLLSAPVFVDTVFMLLLPLARALSFRTGRNYLLYALAICVGAILTNGTVPPAPGPLVAAGILKVDLGWAIAAGFAFSLFPAAAGYSLAKYFNARMPVPPRPALGETLEQAAAQAARPESELPGFWFSIAPVLLPIGLIAAASTVDILGHAFGIALPSALTHALAIGGDKNVALVIGAVIALTLLARRKGLGWRSATRAAGPPLEAAGVIILVVSAGGAYGAMIKDAGVGEAVRHFAGGHAINFVLLAWTMTALVRAAQGSATVAMITGAGIVMSIAGKTGLGVNPIYVLLACGYGSKFMPWMNDGGFWVVSRFGCLTQGELLRSFTPLACIVSMLGLAEVAIASSLWPGLG